MLLLDLFGKAVDGAFLAGPGRDMQHHAVIGTPFVKFLQSPRDRAVGVVCALCDGGEFLEGACGECIGEYMGMEIDQHVIASK